MSFFKEFREFILKGSMMDMAVGIVIGAAFSTVVKSLVDNVIMPPIGLITGGVDFSQMSITLKEGQTEVTQNEDGTTAAVAEEVTLNYGQFINDCIALVLVGFCLFLLIKAYNNAKTRFDKTEEAPKAPPEPSNEEKLLTEIRDLLAKQS